MYCDVFIFLQIRILHELSITIRSGIYIEIYVHNWLAEVSGTQTYHQSACLCIMYIHVYNKRQLCTSIDWLLAVVHPILRMFFQICL